MYTRESCDPRNRTGRGATLGSWRRCSSYNELYTHRGTRSDKEVPISGVVCIQVERIPLLSGHRPGSTSHGTDAELLHNGTDHHAELKHREVLSGAVHRAVREGQECTLIMHEIRQCMLDSLRWGRGGGYPFCHPPLRPEALRVGIEVARVTVHRIRVQPEGCPGRDASMGNTKMHQPGVNGRALVTYVEPTVILGPSWGTCRCVQDGTGGKSLKLSFLLIQISSA